MCMVIEVLEEQWTMNSTTPKRVRRPRSAIRLSAPQRVWLSENVALESLYTLSFEMDSRLRAAKVHMRLSVLQWQVTQRCTASGMPKYGNNKRVRLCLYFLHIVCCFKFNMQKIFAISLQWVAQKCFKPKEVKGKVLYVHTSD